MSSIPVVTSALTQSGKSGTIRESNQTSGVRKAYVQNSSILSAGTGIGLRKKGSVA